MSARPGNTPRAPRMLLALDALNCDSALIDVAARLATALGAELEVLFVEDDDLYAVADLPITQEICRGSARERELSPESLGNALRALSRNAESRFRAVARNGRFSSTRARRSTALSEASSGADLMLLLPARRIPLSIHLRLQGPARTRVTAICGDSPASDRTLELAARLARDDGDTLRLLTVGPADETLVTGLMHGGLRIERRDFAAGSHLAEILAQASNRAGDTLVVAADLPLAESREALLEQISALRCQCLLVN